MHNVNQENEGGSMVIFFRCLIFKLSFGHISGDIQRVMGNKDLKLKREFFMEEYRFLDYYHECDNRNLEN